MKRYKNLSTLIYGLLLLLSLVSFSGVANQSPSETFKTVLVVDSFEQNRSRSFLFKDFSSKTFSSPLKYSISSFKTFVENYNLNEITSFKRYNNHTYWIRIKQLHTIFYPHSIHKTLYQNHIV